MRRCIGCKAFAFQIQHGIALISIGLFSACDVNHDNVKNGNEQNDNLTSELPAAEVPIDSVLVSRAYPMTNLSAGPFRIGDVIQDTIYGFEVEKSTEVRTLSDGMTIEIPVYSYYIGNEGWVRITPLYDKLTGQVSGNIGEIYVCSELFMTDKCIGAISSLEHFASVYPDINIRYLSADDMFSIETSQLPDVRFLLGREYFIGSDPSLCSKLDLSDFNNKSHFHAIRISQQ